ncbi:DNA-binding response regulator [Paenibacillus sp. 598K]|uniref:response regulator transcription factor n=1 Tax=Paenibacillus sp. 598K TaxID=1117987 RepID=UPI000FF9817B|nr:response regulator [Paenibacillus sp. 598K]GBF76154.1 DNA-binding response regulator [Paenibacillus sp. 598K]
MFKVLLVDDEVFVRKGLQKLIRWSDYDCAVVGEAKHGGEALELIRQLEPDLVVTDIMMPVLDGLELVRLAQEEACATPEFILVSGHNEFKYAQQAIRYGVQDYILKPIDVMELASRLEKLADKMRRKQMIALAGEGNTSGMLLETLVQQRLEPEEEARYAEALGLVDERRMLFVWAEVQTEAELTADSLRHIREQLVADDELLLDVPVLERQPGLFGILLQEPLLGSGDADITLTLEQLQCRMAARLRLTVILYVGDSVARIAELRHTYDSASEAMKHKYAEEGSLLVCYGDVKERPLCLAAIDPSMQEQLMVALEEYDRAALSDATATVFQMFREQRYALAAVISGLGQLGVRFIGVIRQMGGDAEIEQQLLETMERASPTWSLAQLRRHFQQMTERAASQIARLRQTQRKGDIDRIKQYIDTHFRDNLNLKGIAGKFYMNPVYLGQLFRKTYGVYFNDYLLELRVEEAKRLLRQTDLRVYEIAAKVGIPVPNYFTSQFEKRERISPVEYRERLGYHD